MNCEFDPLQQAQTCAQTETGAAILQALKRQYNISGSTFSDLLNGLDNHINESMHTAQYSCPNGGGTVTYDGFLSTLALQPITSEQRQLAALIADPVFMANVIRNPQGSSESVFERIAFEMAWQRHPVEGLTRSHGLMGSMRASDEFGTAFYRAMAQLRHPIFSALISDEFARSNLTISPLVVGNTFRQYSQRNPTLLANMEGQQLQACARFANNLKQLICYPEWSDPSDTSTENYISAQYEDSNPASQVALMAVACSPAQAVEPVTIFDRKLYESRVSAGSYSFLVGTRDENGLPIPQDMRGSISPGDTSFQGYASQVCVTRSGVGSVFGNRVAESGIYQNGVFRAPSTLDAGGVSVEQISIISTSVVSRPFDFTALGTLDVPALPNFAEPAATINEPVNEVSAPVNPEVANAAPLPPVPPQNPAAYVPAALPLPVAPVEEVVTPSVATSNTVAIEPTRGAPLGPTNTELVAKIDSLERQVLESNIREMTERSARLAEEQRRAQETITPPIEEEITEVATPVVRGTERRLGIPDRTPASLAPAAVVAAPAIAPPVEVARVAEAPSFSPISAAEAAAPINFNEVVDRGTFGLAGRPSVTSAGISRSLAGSPRTVLIRRSANGTQQLTTEEGQPLNADTALTDQQILTLLSDINNDANVVASIRLADGQAVISVGNRLIPINLASIPDQERRDRISFLIGEIRQRQIDKVRTVFAERLAARLIEARQ